MVLFEVKTNEAEQLFKETKKFLTHSKSWKLSTKIELTVFDGLVQIVGYRLIRQLETLIAGTCKLVVPINHWNELIQNSNTPTVKIVVSEGEAMVGRVTVKVATTFFKTDKILRSIQIPAPTKSIDFLKLEYQDYTKEELQFNQMDEKIS
jgi:hypothetical protein